MIRLIDYGEKELRTLKKIDKRINVLEETLDKMDDTNSKVKHCLEQEKALHEIRRITREENHIDKLSEKSEKSTVNGAIDIINEISNRIDKLDKDLDSLNDDDSKVKKYIAQKETIHDIKKLVKSIL